MWGYLVHADAEVKCVCRATECTRESESERWQPIKTPKMNLLAIIITISTAELELHLILLNSSSRKLVLCIISCITAFCAIPMHTSKVKMVIDQSIRRIIYFMSILECDILALWHWSMYIIICPNFDGAKSLNTWKWQVIDTICDKNYCREKIFHRIVCTLSKLIHTNFLSWLVLSNICHD